MRLNIPLENYTDDVREIVTMPVDYGYTSMLVDKSNEDLETALQILESYQKCSQKQEYIIAELRIRKMPECIPSKSKHNQSFCDEWNKVTQKFKDAYARRNAKAEIV